MMREQDLERRLADWLSDGPVTAPTEVVDKAIERTVGRRQRHPLWGRLREPLDRARARDETRVVVPVLAAVSIAFWYPCLVQNKVPVAAQSQAGMLPWRAAQRLSTVRQWDALLWDSVAQFYPWRLLLERGLHSGELPLWSPYQYCGYPLVGNGQSSQRVNVDWVVLERREVGRFRIVVAARGRIQVAERRVNNVEIRIQRERGCAR